MAILRSLSGISVTVHDDAGQAFPEFADPKPDIVENIRSTSCDIVSKYIEVPSDGGRFFLNFRVEPPYEHGLYGITFRPEISGERMDTGATCFLEDMKHNDMKRDGVWEGVADGCYDTSEHGQILKLFHFAKLKILPGNGESVGLSKAAKKYMEGIGMIQVRVLLAEQRGEPRPPSINKTTPTKDTATEKIVAKKTLYAEELVDTAVPSFDVNYLEGWEYPIAVFQFKYRSKADLRSLLIGTTEGLEMVSAYGRFPTRRATLALSLTSKLFEDLTFDEIRGIAEMQYKSFSELGADEIENLAKQGYSEIIASYPLPARAPKLFKDLTFTEVRDLARSQYKPFNDLNAGEIEMLAKQKHSEGNSSPPINLDPYENRNKATIDRQRRRNGPRNQRASIMFDDGDDDDATGSD